MHTLQYFKGLLKKKIVS